MLKEHNKVVAGMHRLHDIGLTVVAFVSAYGIKKHLLPEKFQGLSTDPNYYVILLLTVIVWHIVFSVYGLYSSHRGISLRSLFTKQTKAVLVAMILLQFCLYVLKIGDVSRLMMFIFMGLNILLLTVSKGLIYLALSRLRENGINTRNVLIIGSRERAAEAIRAFSKNARAGYNIVGCLETDPGSIGQHVSAGVHVICLFEDLETALKQHVIDELVFAMPVNEIDRVEAYMALAEEMGVTVRIMPDWTVRRFVEKTGSAYVRFEDFLGLPTLAKHSTPIVRDGYIFKWIFDYLFAIIGLIAFAPVFVGIAVAVKCVSSGPVIYKQTRLGKNGRRFTLYKFRTMVVGADRMRSTLEECNEADGPVFKIKDDPRIIPYIGKFLRKSSLDELPQLVNVLKGEMSIIGPRPPLPNEVDTYATWHRRRLSMKPGITCIWQTEPQRNTVCFEDWIKMDLLYIDNWSLWMDAKILFRTALTVLGASGR